MMPKPGMPKTAALLLVFLLLLVSPLGAKIYTNHPELGGTLEILVERAATGCTGGPCENQTVLITSPDGKNISLPLKNGQAGYIVLRSGRWVVQVGDERAVVLVPEPMLGGAASAPVPPAWLVVLAAGILVILVMAMAAIWTLAFPPAGGRGACLEKKWDNGDVSVRLTAGAAALEQVKLVDVVGAEWKDAPLILRSRRLAARQALNMHYEYAGAPAAARAEFVQNGKHETLECAQGKACTGGVGEAGDGKMGAGEAGGKEKRLPVREKKETGPKRRLSRA